jgi:hypothetical protein
MNVIKSMMLCGDLVERHVGRVPRSGWVEGEVAGPDVLICCSGSLHLLHLARIPSVL